MSVLPPSWAMGAVAINGSGDVHLAPGVHLRVFHALELGLPIRPFLVYRLTGEEVQDRLGRRVRTDITWIDERGRILTPPFEVRPGNPVTGTIPRAPGVRCIAVALVAGREGRVGSVLTHRVEVERGEGDLRVDAFVDTPEGRRHVGRRERPPYVLAAPDTHGVRVRGTGVVRGGMWVQADVSIVRRLEVTRLLDLPVSSAARYEGLPDAEARAVDRVRRGAPRRFGLHDDPSVAGPAAAAPATPDDEEERVRPLAEELRPHLDQVLNDLGARPRRLGRPQELLEGVHPEADASAEIMSLSAVLAATADPGVAKWLGTMDVDADPEALSPSGVLYLVRGFFGVELSLDPEVLGPARLLSLLASGGMLTGDLSSPLLPFDVPHRSADDFPVFDFTVPVVVFPGAPPERPNPPGIAAPLAPAVLVAPGGSSPPATADGQGPWLAEAVPPAAVREVALPLSDLEAAPNLAAAREEPGALVPLNERHPVSGRALALVPATPDDAEDTGTGRLFDRAAPPGSVAYRVAATDWFGRWSEWATRSIPAKARTPPPAPIFEVHYEIAPATPVDDAPRFGTLRARINVPKPEDLAPGSRLLVRGTVEATIGGVDVTASADLASPTQDHLDVEVPAPPGMIARAGQVTARVNARWNDGVVDGPPGEAQERVLVDPRPPVPPPPPPRPPVPASLDPSLRYSARPDAVGRARVVLEWPAQPGTRYRVYTTDETRLRGALQERADGGDAVAGSLLQALAGERDPAVRGQLYTDPSRAGLYVRELFTNLTAEPLRASAPGPLRFSHDLSGSLSVLAFFKVVSLSANNVESPFTQATLVPVGVPSDGPPPRPLLDFLGWTEDEHARLRVTVVRGPQPAACWRLRRSFSTSEDPLRMPVVAEGTAPAADGDGPAVFEIEDAGADAFAGGTLRPWTRTSWRVEVQAPSPPGSSLPGEWSPASGPAGGMLVPPAPAAATDLAVDAVTPTGVILTWRHPEPLRKGSQGGYRFDVYRRLPGEPEERAGAVLADDPGHVSGSGPGRTFSFEDDLHPVGTSWRVVTLDPMGRLSPPSNPARRNEAP
jgi:hypothetical protein